MFSASSSPSSSQEDPRNSSNPNSAHLLHGVNPLRGILSQESAGGGWGGYGHGDDGSFDFMASQAEVSPSAWLNAIEQQPNPSPFSSQESNETVTGLLQPFPSQPQIPTLLSGDLPSSLPPSHNDSPIQSSHGYPQHISPAQLNMTLDRSNPVSPNPYPTPQTGSVFGDSPVTNYELNFGAAGDAGAHRRTGSAASHHTTHTSNSFSGGSECSYSATDVSENEDADMGNAENDGLPDLKFGRMALKGEKTWTQYDQDAVNAAGGAGHGAGAVGRGGGVGPVRRTSGNTTGKADKDKDKLEHRRSINRKSAQKHRARRKEELEEHIVKLAERDARIVQLERELAVERARNVELKEFVDRLQGSGGDSRRGSDAGSSSNAEQETSAGGRRTRGTKKADPAKAKVGTIYGDGRDAGW